MKTQDYKIEIIIKADVSKKSVKEWLPDALDEGDWKYKVVKLYSSDITPIDRENPDYKWLNDMDSHDNNTEEY
tara:strand:+ start:250 stop:468 length:219 start_codon:yes stop_codon:yes gene_type:complete